MVTSLVEKTKSSVIDLPLGWTDQPKALVVDDDPCLLQVMHQMLQTLGFKSEAASGGRAAMGCLTRSRYDLLVTDLQMPDMDGYALSGWLKHHPKGKDTKVIVMTGLSYADVVTYMNTGIVDCWMFKPFSFNKLAGILNELLPAFTGKHFVDRTGPRETGRPNGVRPMIIDSAPIELTDDSRTNLTPRIHDMTGDIVSVEKQAHSWDVDGCLIKNQNTRRAGNC